MWKRSKERNTVFAKYMLVIASLFKIFLRELFSFSSTRSHQGFIASIYLVHFHHIIRTFYKCHKCVTSNKLFSLGFVWYYLQKETPLDRYTVKKKKFMKQWTSSSIYSWNIIVESTSALHCNISSLLEYIMNIIMNIMNIIFYLWTSY